MAKFTLKKLPVKVTDDEGNFFEVRGLSPNDIAQLLMLHKPIMNQLFNQYAAENPDELTVEQIADSASVIAMAVIEEAPAFVAHCIVLAADDTENFDEYARLPVGIQVDALTKIGQLTFEMAGGAKKLLDLVKGFMKAKTRSVPAP